MNGKASPPPVRGRRNETIQTEKFLEELAIHPYETDVACQTDLYLERPMTPQFIPTKTGVDVGVQVDEQSENFDIERELKLVIDDCVARAFVEVAQDKVDLGNRSSELSPRNPEDASGREKRTSAANILQGYVAELLPSILNSIKSIREAENNAELKKQLAPWLAQEISQEVGQIIDSRELLKELVKEILQERAELYVTMSGDNRVAADKINLFEDDTFDSQRDLAKPQFPEKIENVLSRNVDVLEKLEAQSVKVHPMVLVSKSSTTTSDQVTSLESDDVRSERDDTIEEESDVGLQKKDESTLEDLKNEVTEKGEGIVNQVEFREDFQDNQEFSSGDQDSVEPQFIIEITPKSPSKAVDYLMDKKSGREEEVKEPNKAQEDTEDTQDIPISMMEQVKIRNQESIERLESVQDEQLKDLSNSAESPKGNILEESPSIEAECANIKDPFKEKTPTPTETKEQIGDDQDSVEPNLITEITPKSPSKAADVQMEEETIKEDVGEKNMAKEDKDDTDNPIYLMKQVNEEIIQDQESIERGNQLEKAPAVEAYTANIKDPVDEKNSIQPDHKTEIENNEEEQETFSPTENNNQIDQIKNNDELNQKKNASDCKEETQGQDLIIVEEQLSDKRTENNESLGNNNETTAQEKITIKTVDSAAGDNTGHDMGVDVYQSKDHSVQEGLIHAESYPTLQVLEETNEGMQKPKESKSEQNIETNFTQSEIHLKLPLLDITPCETPNLDSISYPDDDLLDLAVEDKLQQESLQESSSNENSKHMYAREKETTFEIIEGAEVLSIKSSEKVSSEVEEDGSETVKVNINEELQHEDRVEIIEICTRTTISGLTSPAEFTEDKETENTEKEDDIEINKSGCEQDPAKTTEDIQSILNNAQVAFEPPQELNNIESHSGAEDSSSTFKKMISFDECEREISSFVDDIEQAAKSIVAAQTEMNQVLRNKEEAIDLVHSTFQSALLTVNNVGEKVTSVVVETEAIETDLLDSRDEQQDKHQLEAPSNQQGHDQVDHLTLLRLPSLHNNSPSISNAQNDDSEMEMDSLEIGPEKDDNDDVVMDSDSIVDQETIPMKSADLADQEEDGKL